MKYYLIAGEASGDLHGSNLIDALKKEDPQASFRFLGGDRMAKAAGQTPVVHYREMAYMGFRSVIAHAPALLNILKRCKKDIISWQPDVLILIDYASFNLRIAAWVKKHSAALPIHFYISPKIWAWKSWRIKSFKRYIDSLYIIFPFEKAFFDRHRYPVTYVGNPTVDSVAAFRAEWNCCTDAASVWLSLHGFAADRPILALLPGSRRQEIQGNLPLMIEAAKPWQEQFQVIVSGAPGVPADFYEPIFAAKACTFPIVFGETYPLLSVAHTALVVSGTATLETALFKVPQVVCYQMPYNRTFTRFLRRFIIRTPFISLVNLVAGEEVVKELVSWEYTWENLTAELQRLVGPSTPGRAAVLAGYDRIETLLGEPGAAAHTARCIVSSLSRPLR